MIDREEDARADELGGDMSVDSETPVAHGRSAARETRTPASPGPTAQPAPEQVPEPARPQRNLKVPLLAAGLVVALATAGVFATLYLTRATSPEEVTGLLAAERPEVADTAGQIANLLLNYDSTNLEEVSRQMLDLATGNFREQYEEVLSQGAGLGAALEEASASSRGQILEGPEVYFARSSEAIAILRVTQTAQSNSNPAGSTIDYVLKITLIDTADGGWKADRVEVLSSQQS